MNTEIVHFYFDDNNCSITHVHLHKLLCNTFRMQYDIYGEMKSEPFTRASQGRLNIIAIMQKDKCSCRLTRKCNITVTDANDCLNAYEYRLPDAVVVDMNQPDAHSAIAKLSNRIDRDQYLTNKPPIIGLISFAKDSPRVAYNAGVSVVLHKPIHIVNLHSTICEILSKKEYIMEVDKPSALELVGGDEDFLKELLCEEIVATEVRVQSITMMLDDSEISERDWERLYLISQSGRSGAAQLGAKPLSRAWYILNQIARNKLVEDISDALISIEMQCRNLEEYWQREWELSWGDSIFLAPLIHDGRELE
jgi:CheY-like chemotaxis protein